VVIVGRLVSVLAQAEKTLALNTPYPTPITSPKKNGFLD
jgi:hypothetical protein